jgi:hypothetical protein
VLLHIPLHYRQRNGSYFLRAAWIQSRIQSITYRNGFEAQKRRILGEKMSVNGSIGLSSMLSKWTSKMLRK